MALVKYNNNSISAVTSAASIPSGAMTLIKTLTASSSSTLSFVHGSSDVVLDSTYPIYMFKFISIHAGTDDTGLTVGFRDGSTDYDATKTSSFFRASHGEDGSSVAVAYVKQNNPPKGVVIVFHTGVDDDFEEGLSIHHAQYAQSSIDDDTSNYLVFKDKEGRIAYGIKDKDSTYYESFHNTIISYGGKEYTYDHNATAEDNAGV